MANISTIDRTGTLEQPDVHQEHHTRVTLFCSDNFEESVKELYLKISKAGQFVEMTVSTCKEEGCVELESRILRLNKKQCQHLDARLKEALKECQSCMGLLKNTLAAEEFHSVLLRASSLVQECSCENWLLKAVELGDSPEHFVEVLLDLRWAVGLVHLKAGEIDHLDQLREEQEKLRGALRGQNVEEMVLRYRNDDRIDLKVMVQTAEDRNREDCQERRLALLLKDRQKQINTEVPTQPENPCTSEPPWHPKELEEFVTGFWFEFGIKTTKFLKLGGSGIVLKFPPLYYGKSFALKMPIADRYDWEDFQREANILRRYGSPYIVGLVGYWKFSRKSWCQEQKKISFLMMEMMDLNLKDLIDKVRELRAGGREGFSPLEAINLMLPVAKAMQYLHEGAVAHRDLKPENIMCKDFKYKGDVTKDLEDITVKLVDFGEAVEVVKNVKPTAGYWHPAGTFGYMAPEVHNRTADDLLKADVYSFGMVFGEMLTWKAPWEAFGDEPTRNQIWEKLKSGKRPILPKETPFYVKFIVESCWNKHPRIRPPFEDICMMLRHAKLLVDDPDLNPEFFYTDDDGVEHAPWVQGNDDGMEVN